MDGFDAAQEIRRAESAKPGASSVPIIAMTANAMKGDRERCIASGMNEYMSKPVRMEVLREMLKKFTGGSSTKVPAGAPPAARTEAVPIWDHEFSLSMASGDRELNNTILKMFLEWSKDTAQSLHVALAAGDLRKIGYEGHSIAGAAANIGAKPLSTCGRAIEQAAKVNNLENARTLESRFDRELKDLTDQIARYLESEIPVASNAETRL